jgi:hypothetical protein
MPIIFGILGSIASVARLPALAAFLGGIFAQVVGLFATKFTISTAIQVGAIASIVGLTLILLVAFKTLMFGLTAAFPPFYSQAMSLIIPTNLLPCLTAIMSAKIVRWVWIWQVYFIQSVASARG